MCTTNSQLAYFNLYPPDSLSLSACLVCLRGLGLLSFSLLRLPIHSLKKNLCSFNLRRKFAGLLTFSPGACWTDKKKSSIGGLFFFYSRCCCMLMMVVFVSTQLLCPCIHHHTHGELVSLSLLLPPTPPFSVGLMEMAPDGVGTFPCRFRC